MNFKQASLPARVVKRARAFTLAEVLAAMMLMAIVIPVAVQGLRIASLAGTVGRRKIVAARVGNKVLNELKVTGQLRNSSQSGVVEEGDIEYDWAVRSQAWPEDMTTPMTQVTITVSYFAQGKSYDVKLSTLLPQNTAL